MPMSTQFISFPLLKVPGSKLHSLPTLNLEPSTRYDGASHRPIAQLSRGGSWSRQTASNLTPGPPPAGGIRHRSHSRSHPSWSAISPTGLTRATIVLFGDTSDEAKDG